MEAVRSDSDDIQLRLEYETLIYHHNESSISDANSIRESIKTLIATRGLPLNANIRLPFPSEFHSEIQPNSPTLQCSLRGQIWKILLRIGHTKLHSYAQLVSLGASKDSEKIRIDALRTFRADTDFISRVSEASLNRVLNAFCHSRGNQSGCYVQSMSLLCAPFLYQMTEPDAFLAFEKFVSCYAPRYVTRYSGVLDGFRILERILDVVDRPLSDHLISYDLKPEVYAFPIISTLNSCVPPISESSCLWDICLAFGVYWGILFTVARLIECSAKLRESSRSRAPLVTRELELGLGIPYQRVIISAFDIMNQLFRDQNKQLIHDLIKHPVEPLQSGTLFP
eukprot:CAMPEP_0182443670 /NCGR_PEP_ID=MMETSP1172-20130603/2348_1 /TAXON_ID=708627 /ORGANISM="Timspurckia oligopyrenoides, Strain CCMP3278" /LENGTH=338 /DNA_ID=CAMNT_0024639023 /DNA_START=179 /DNA_END=1195 /DNA_ORIENTATION=-